MNHIIKRIEYAADLLAQYKCIAGDEMYVEPHYDGTRVSYGQSVGGGIKKNPLETGVLYIGIAASTGSLKSTQKFTNFIVNGVIANLDSPIGTAYQSGDSYILTNNANSQVGAVWKTSQIGASSFSASFDYDISGDAQADGFTLIFSANKFLAGTGGGLGYQGGDTKSVAIEIDIYQNAPFDPNNSHIAILKNADVSNHLSLASPTVRPSGTIGCVYSNKTLYVYHNGGLIITYGIDIPSIVAGQELT